MDEPIEDDLSNRERPFDDEHASRLVIADWVDGGRLTGAAFAFRKSPSLWVNERIPAPLTPDDLHKGTLASNGRWVIAVRDLRATQLLKAGLPSDESFDLAMTPEQAVGEFEPFKDAHSSLLGPYGRRTPKGRTPASALAAQFNRLGSKERDAKPRSEPSD